MALAQHPVAFQTPILGPVSPSFRDFVAPGVMLTIVFFLAVSLTAVSLISERVEGMFDRSWVAGVYPGEIMFAHVISQMVIVCGQTAVVVIFMFLVFHIKCDGNIFLVALLTILEGMCGMCNGFLISAICQSERTATQLALGSFYPYMILSGILWPLEAMPIWLRYISMVLPLTIPTNALRAIMIKGFGFTAYEVYMGFITTITWTNIFIICACITFKSKYS